jgi:hypothetical protein
LKRHSSRSCIAASGCQLSAGRLLLSIFLNLNPRIFHAVVLSVKLHTILVLVRKGRATQSLPCHSAEGARLDGQSLTVRNFPEKLPRTKLVRGIRSIFYYFQK